ncbi:MAG TPA: hypothetical protein VFH29_05190 [Anaerolineales bacterium]|nr:hypothetical protein [Anaerolineales bacterium]
MNHMKKTGFRLLGVAPILALLVLSACATGYPATLCHATGDAANPYELVTVTGSDAAVHLQHPNDFGPAPVGGCPTTQVTVTNGTLLLCHATNVAANPYEQVSVNANGLSGHGAHVGDLLPVPEGGCPTGPVPVGTGTAQSNDGKITICHATGSSKNPYVMITIDMSGLNGHKQHAGDIIPAPAEGCPKP